MNKTETNYIYSVKPRENKKNLMERYDFTSIGEIQYELNKLKWIITSTTQSLDKNKEQCKTARVFICEYSK